MAGYFQPDKGQFGCISCDVIGDFYQELSAQSSCKACPPSTQRFIGVLTAATKSSCQCKEGDVYMVTSLVGFSDLRLLAVQASLTERAGPERYDALRRFGSHNELFASVLLAPLRLRFPRLASIRLMLGARSWTFRLQACEKCTTRRSPFTLRSSHLRPNVRLGGGCAGPMGASCDGQLASPRERAPMMPSFAPPAAAIQLCTAMSRASERIAERAWCYSQAPIFT
jgi:hypothetical protein